VLESDIESPFGTWWSLVEFGLASRESEESKKKW
jgi:hypothetical protein